MIARWTIVRHLPWIAEIHYPTEPLFGISLAIIWIAILGVLGLLALAAKTGSAYIARQVTDELQRRIFSSEDDKSDGIVSSWFHYVADKTGILRAVHAQVKIFENKIAEYEGKIRAETALRIKREVEADKSRDFIERVREIQHDMRSPLSSLLFVQDAIKGDDDIRIALSSGIRGLQNMIDELSRVEGAAKSPRLAIVEVIAEETIALVRPKFSAAKKINVSIRYDAERLSPVLVVPDEMARVIENLLENAFDASSPGGLIQLAVSANQSTCLVIVEDQGAGVPQRPYLALV